MVAALGVENSGAARTDRPDGSAALGCRAGAGRRGGGGRPLCIPPSCQQLCPWRLGSSAVQHPAAHHGGRLEVGGDIGGRRRRRGRVGGRLAALGAHCSRRGGGPGSVARRGGAQVPEPAPGACSLASGGPVPPAPASMGDPPRHRSPVSARRGAGPARRGASATRPQPGFRAAAVCMVAWSGAQCTRRLGCQVELKAPAWPAC